MRPVTGSESPRRVGEGVAQRKRQQQLVVGRMPAAGQPLQDGQQEHAQVRGDEVHREGDERRPADEVPDACGECDQRGHRDRPARDADPMVGREDREQHRDDDQGDPPQHAAEAAGALEVRAGIRIRPAASQVLEDRPCW